MANNVRIVVNVDNRASTGITNLNADLRNLVSQVDNTNNSVVRTTGSLNNMHGVLGRFGTHVAAMTAVFAGLHAIEAAASDAKDAIIGFDSEMAKVAAFTSVGAENIGKFSQEMKDISVQTGISAKDMASSLYFVGSAGLKANQVLDVTKMSGMAAAAGLGSAADVGRVLVSVLNAYGDTGIDAAKALDILTVGAREGNAEVSEYAKALGRILPLASQMKIEFPELIASMSTLTNIGMDANTASTAIRALGTSILQSAKAGTDQSKALAEMGLSYQGLMNDIKNPSIGFSGVLAKIWAAGKDNIEVLERFLPNIRALSGELGLAAAQGEKHAETTDKARNATGEFQKAYDIAMQSVAAQSGKVKTSIEAIGIGIGERVLPHVVDLAKSLATALGPAIKDAGAQADEANDKFAPLGRAISDIKDIVDQFSGSKGQKNIFDDLTDSAKNFSEFASKDPAMAAILGIAAAGTLAIGSSIAGKAIGMGGALGSAGITAIGGASAAASAGAGVLSAGGGLGNAIGAGMGTLGSPLMVYVVGGVAAAATGTAIDNYMQSHIAGNNISDPEYGRDLIEEAKRHLQDMLGMAPPGFNSGTYPIYLPKVAEQRAAQKTSEREALTQYSGYEPPSRNGGNGYGGYGDNAVANLIESDKQDAIETSKAALEDFKTHLNDSFAKALEDDSITKHGRDMIKAVENLFKLDAFDPAIKIAIGTIGEFGAQVQLAWSKSLSPEQYDKWTPRLQDAMKGIADAEALQLDPETAGPEAEQRRQEALARLRQVNIDQAAEQSKINRDAKIQQDADTKRRKDLEDARKARDNPSVGFAESTAGTAVDDMYKYTGAGAVSALNQLTGDDPLNINKALGSKIRSELAKVKEDLKKSNIPGWQETWNDIFSAAEEAVNTGSPALIQRVNKMIADANDSIRSKRELTVDSFRTAFGRTAIEEGLGQNGGSIVETLRKGLEDGLDDMAPQLAGSVNKLGREIQSTFPTDIARDKFSLVMDAIKTVIEEKTPEAQAALKDILLNLNLEEGIQKIGKSYQDAIEAADRSKSRSMYNLSKQNTERLNDEFIDKAVSEGEALQLGQYGEGKYGKDEAARMRAEKKLNSYNREGEQLTLGRGREDEDTTRSRDREDKLREMQKNMNAMTVDKFMALGGKQLTEGDLAGLSDSERNKKIADYNKQKDAAKEEALDKLKEQQQQEQMQKRVRDLQRKWQDEDRDRARQRQDDDRNRQRSYQDQDEQKEIKKAEAIEIIRSNWDNYRSDVKIYKEQQSINNQMQTIQDTWNEANRVAGQTFVDALDKIQPIDLFGDSKTNLEDIIDMYATLTGRTDVSDQMHSIINNRGALKETNYGTYVPPYIAGQQSGTPSGDGSDSVSGGFLSGLVNSATQIGNGLLDFFNGNKDTAPAPNINVNIDGALWTQEAGAEAARVIVRSIIDDMNLG